MEMRPRVIPTLLLKNSGLVKSEKFKTFKYLGDPINIVKIFNEKEVDEIMVLDILASKEGREPQYDLLKDIAGEAFMPLGYGGGLKNVEQIRKILSLGFEKVCLNASALANKELIREASQIFGSSTIVICIDVKKNFWGKHEVYNHADGKTYGSPAEWAQNIEALGAGELIINSVDRDGTLSGYDLELTKSVSSITTIPVIACGGAGAKVHFSEAVKSGGASAVAAGSFFVFQGPHRAVLISYPSDKELRHLLVP